MYYIFKLKTQHFSYFGHNLIIFELESTTPLVHLAITYKKHVIMRR